MKKTILFLGLVCFISTLSAQVLSITGKVMDSDRKSPLVCAGVELLQASDSSLVCSEMTDKNGDFMLMRLSKGKYLVKVYYFGYQDYVSTPIELTKGTLDLGTIVMQPSMEMLQAVQITYRKPLFEQKLGKTVMNVESHPSAAGDNVLELLRKMPGVIVDNSDNISLQGKSGVLILVDDKDPHLSGDDLTNFLKSMPASVIDRVEVMKNPSARYDAEGTSGIINLVTKHVHTNGINGSVWAGAGYNGAWDTNEGFNLTGRVGKWVLTGSYYYMNYSQKMGFDSEQITFLQNDTLRQTSNENPDEIWNGHSNFQSHGINFGADCYIDSVNTISFSYRGELMSAGWNMHSFNRLYRNSQLYSAFENNTSSLMKHGNHQFNFNYKHQFDTLGTLLFADVTYSLDHSRHNDLREMPYYSDDFMTPLFTRSYRGLSYPSRMHVASAKLDFEHPFNDRVSLECGLKTSLVRNDNNSVNYLNDSLLESKSNHFRYTESITAGYVQGNFQIDNQLTIQAGLRAEYAHVQGNLLTTGEVNTQDYADVFPSLQIDYQLPKMNNLSFAMRSRISRPNYRSLNPYVDIQDDYSYSTGNPNLEPTYTHSISVDYSWHYMLFLSLGYEYTRGTEEEMMFTDKVTNIRMTRPENIGKQHAFTASLFAQVPIAKWWMMMLNANYLLGKQTFEYETQTVSSLKSNLQLYMMNSFPFLKHYAIELGIWWMPKQANTFGTRNGVFYMWGGAKASFFKDAFTVRLGVKNICNQRTWQMNYVYPDGSVVNQRWMGDGIEVSLDLSYRFGKQNIQMRQRRGGDNDEFDRMGGGGGQGGQGGGAQGGKMP